MSSQPDIGPGIKLSDVVVKILGSGIIAALVIHGSDQTG
jgi:hypothetical protein